ncbi:hypothetical protein SLS62_009403 [Diatrype stigma]|uniref:AB hydrolase-1 domain-containing protein n=1 Tax=Diatrype stigma TaxID=117547 RepID=A0AAN9YLA9_9PEZI
MSWQTTEPFRFPTVEEITQDPAFPTAIWQLEPHQKGLLPVAVGRGGPLNISWEIHGEGPIKLLLINGLGIFNSSWQRQTVYFGHQRASQYSVLIVDNRGMGKSSRPLLRYSTSEMARDVLEVLDHVGWGVPSPSSPASPSSTTTRCVHVCGSSMGGMIAQELACLAPTRIASLLLCSTAAELERDASTTTLSSHLASRARALLPKTADQAVRYTAECCFAPGWLPQPDDVSLPDPATTPGVLPSLAADGAYRRFASNYARFAAQDVWKQRDPEGGFTRLGTLLQMVAVGWHRKTAAQLAAMADRVGRERILVLHGAEDGIIGVRHGRKLIEHLGLAPERGLIVEDGLGHAPFIERPGWFNELLEALCADGERLSGRGGPV